MLKVRERSSVTPRNVGVGLWRMRWLLRLRLASLRVSAGSSEKMVLTVFSRLTVIFYFSAQAARESRACCSLLSPMKRVSIRNPDAPHVSETTRELMCRRRAAREARRDGDNGGAEEYRSLNRQVNSVIRRDVREDIGQRIIDHGPNSIYRNVRQVIGSKKGARVTPVVSADEMNEYFVGVGPRVAREIAESGGAPGDFTCRLPRVGSCAFTVSTIDFDTLTRALLGLWIFHRLLGGGAFERPPP